MRTTGVRCAPVPAPRPKQPQDPPKPLPRTKFLQKTTSEEPPDTPPEAPPKAPPKNDTLTIVSQNLGPPKTRTPPPKPPRSPSFKDSPPGVNAPPSPRRPGLMEVLSRPSSSPPASLSNPQPARAAPQAPQAAQGRGGGLGSVPTRPAPRPRPPPLSLPPPPASVPPRPTPGSAPPRLPLRPSSTQIAASRARAGAPEPRPGTPRSAPGTHSPVCSVEDFEDSCKEVFRNTRHAKDLTSRGKHVQAASHYQVALTALDRVLRAQVLTLTNHEATRQRLFLLQQDVFNLRKEALNGFTDAQTAVRTPRGLSPTRPTPGAPPSYDDVLDEDRRRRRDNPRGAARQPPTSQSSATATSTTSASSSSQRLHPKPNPTHIAPPTARVRPHSTVDPLVDALEPSAAPSRITPSNSHGRAPRKPSRSSATRPKSSYHPSNQSNQPMSLPPPLVPVSVPLQPQSPPPSLPPLPDEVLQSQVKALKVFESAKNPAEPPSVNGASGNLQERKKETQSQKSIGIEGVSAVTILGDIAPELEAGGRRGEKERSRKQGEREGLEAGEGREGGERGGKGEKNQHNTASVSSAVDPFLSLDSLSSAHSQGRREGGGRGGKGEENQNNTASVSSAEDPFLSLDPLSSAHSQPRRGGEREGGGKGEKNQDNTASVSSAEDPFLSLDPLSSAHSQPRREGGGGKDQAKRTIPTSSVSSIDDPFLSLDPFPPVESKEQDNDVVFSVGSPASSTLPPTARDTQHTHSLAFSDNFAPFNAEQNSRGTQHTHCPAFSDNFTALDLEQKNSRETQYTHNLALSDDFTALNTVQKKSRVTQQQPNNFGDNLTDDSTPSNAKQNGRGTQQQPNSLGDNLTDDSTPSKAKQNGRGTQEQQPDSNLGDSILEALDFATTPMQGHRRVSPQSSRGRSYSEENLLDSSHNTLEALLNPNRDVYGSRASIIEEFDPLMSAHDAQTEVEAQSEVEKAANQREERQSFTPTPAPRKTMYVDIQEQNQGDENEGSEYGSSPPGYYTEEGAVALPEPAGVDDCGYPDYPRKQYPDSQFSYTGERLTSCSSDDSSSVTSWQNDPLPGHAYTLPPTSASTFTPASPLYPSLYPQQEEEEEGEEGKDVGRSAFYLPPSEQGDSSRRRDLLRIREGVKIYFIHTDGVITSPWRRPFLAVCKDPAKAQLVGEGLMLSVGKDLWACQLSKKATLVLRTQAGGYVFNEVAGKPECKAVCVRVPSSIRRPQQEFLSKILEQNTLLEEERPKGITKAISKSASSAATRMNKMVENSSMSPTQPFVRRNSIRALKGVSKRLNTIAEKTGATMKELPKEYQPLQEAADTLAFARNAKMIQYI